MLQENIRNLRKAKGWSQEELAIKLNVVRQTVSKWEKGLSVPDSQMLIRIADELDTTVAILLGEPPEQDESPAQNAELKEIAVKLEILNEQFAAGSVSRKQGSHREVESEGSRMPKKLASRHLNRRTEIT